MDVLQRIIASCIRVMNIVHHIYYIYIYIVVTIIYGLYIYLSICVYKWEEINYISVVPALLLCINISPPMGNA